MELKFDLRRAAKEYARRFFDLVYSPLVPPHPADGQFEKNIVPFRALARQIPREVMESRVGNIKELAREMWEEPAEHARRIWQTQSEVTRIFCVCSELHNLLLWAHYADCHRGVALELDGNADTGLPLKVAYRVIYSHEAPALHSRKEWLDVVLGLREHSTPQDVYFRLVLTKAKAWAYEKEWRIVGARRPTDSGEFEDCSFSESNVTGIFLGCKMSPRARAEILKLAKRSFSHAKVFQAVQDAKRYRLKFDQIV